MRIGKNFFLDPVSSAKMSVDQAKGRNSQFDRHDREAALPFFLGEETGTIGDNQPEIAGASHIHARKINFVQNAVAQGEPDAAAASERGADAGLGARSPTRRNARP